MRAGVGLTADQRYPLVLAQASDSCAHYCIIYAAVYSLWFWVKTGLGALYHGVPFSEAIALLRR
ncbi:MAG TPA: hypothetical protein VI457_08920, partial [Methylococcaceae bacterium]|nr:hypothetical protein [Methylococcaceae bacterium]